ncbi:ComEA family DNA-binding protein [Brachybacterium halotolerans subsp. kimchii]|uniref:ComEA family DNA-binding protein n=1 Tax=Brachybacterium halotolerans TaxID=2795215 RepID=UPI001E29E603|nr:ComEA family DNA-binding protein [Brachybacterium halotolerans]UEJ83066.1 ComEA family DNA-binding protein [Brachybacterium halotolerans subsp. kimchii]
MSHASRSARTTGRARSRTDSRRRGERSAPARPRAGRHRRREQDREREDGGAQGQGVLEDAWWEPEEDLVEVREHRGAERPPWWQRIPRPSPAALAGVAVLVLIAGASIHLTGRGSAVAGSEQTAPPVATSASAASAPPDATATADGEPAEQGAADAAASPAPSATASPSGAAAADGADAPGDAGEGTVVVYVSGAVKEPGVVELPAGSRVADALEKAGGTVKTADLTSVNLARVLVDAEQIHVPEEGEEPSGEAATGSTGGAGTSGGGAASGSAADAGQGSGSAASADGPGAGAIDINTADADQLDELPGVGPGIAQRIIDHREQNGPFASVDDLAEVSGIGPATLEKIRPQATV